MGNLDQIDAAVIEIAGFKFLSHRVTVQLFHVTTDVIHVVKYQKTFAVVLTDVESTT